MLHNYCVIDHRPDPIIPLTEPCLIRDISGEAYKFQAKTCENQQTLFAPIFILVPRARTDFTDMRVLVASAGFCDTGFKFFSHSPSKYQVLHEQGLPAHLSAVEISRIKHISDNL